MAIEDFYKLCDKLGMVDADSSTPNNLPELLLFLDELLSMNDTSTMKNLLLCMIEEGK